MTERREICNECPVANPEIAEAASSVLSFMENFKPQRAAEGELVGKIIEQLEQTHEAATPHCERGPKEMFAEGEHRTICGKMAGVIALGRHGIQALDF